LLMWAVIEKVTALSFVQPALPTFSALSGQRIRCALTAHFEVSTRNMLPCCRPASGTDVVPTFNSFRNELLIRCSQLARRSRRRRCGL